MIELPRQFYAFGPFRLDVMKRLLLHDGVPVPLPSKALEMLLALVEQRGRVLDKEVLLRRVWPDQIVEEANLTVNMSALRKASEGFTATSAVKDFINPIYIRAKGGYATGPPPFVGKEPGNAGY